jgi:proton-translocating NADH-quinone oxidoreductase chain N
MNHLPVLLIINPLLAAFSLSLSIPPARKNYKIIIGVSAVIQFALSMAALLTSLQQPVHYHVGGWPVPLGITLILDVSSGFMAAFTSILFTAAVLYSFAYIGRGKARYYYVLLMILWAGLTGMVLTGDLFNMIVFIEIASVTAYSLVAFDETSFSLEASIKYMMLGTVGTILIILATGIIYSSVGSLNIADLYNRIQGIPEKPLKISIALFVAGFGVKTALVPMHTWLADAHSSAPAPISAILSGAFVKVGVFALFKLMYNMYGWSVLTSLGTDQLLINIGAATALIGGIMAANQADLKRMLAYSTISQVGLIVMVLSLGTLQGLTAGFFHMFNHGIAKGALFLSVGSMAKRAKTNRITGLSGIGHDMPLSYFGFTVGALAIVGIPLLNGFMSKWLICSNLIQNGHTLHGIVLIIVSIIGAFYYFRVLERLASPAGPDKKHRETSYGMFVPVVTLAGLCIITGLLPYIPLVVIERASLDFFSYNSIITGIIGGF